jgi:hypothetical protein
MLLECDLGKASKLARMQAFPVLRFELFQCRQADLKMLAYTLPIEFAGHASELDFTVKGLIRHAEQRSVAIQRVRLPPGKGQPASRKRALRGWGYLKSWSAANDDPVKERATTSGDEPRGFFRRTGAVRLRLDRHALFAASSDLGNFAGYKQGDSDYEREITSVGSSRSSRVASTGRRPTNSWIRPYFNRSSGSTSRKTSPALRSSGAATLARNRWRWSGLGRR